MSEKDILNKELDISKGNIAIYQSEDGEIQINAKIEDESIWLTQQMMVDLFQSSKQNISDHIINVFKGFCRIYNRKKV